MLYVKSLGDENYADSDEESKAFLHKGGTSGGDKATYVLTFPDDNKNSNKLQVYDSTWTAKIGTNSWTIQNFNNNNWSSWSWIKCGRGKYTSVACIATDWAIAEAIDKVIVTVDKLTKANVKSTKLEVATDAAFTQNVQTIELSIVEGNMTYNIPAPAENCYYKLTYDCDKPTSGTTNGQVQISKVVYTNE